MPSLKNSNKKKYVIPENSCFLTESRFIEYFNSVDTSMSKNQFIEEFRIAYKNNPNLAELFSVSNIENKKSVIKSTSDSRYLNKNKIINYFYDIIITNRFEYLKSFFSSYFEFTNPYSMKWEKGPDISINRQSIDSDKLAIYNNHDTSDVIKSNLIENVLLNGASSISMQKNDKSKILIRNLNYLDILDKTKITNTSKSKVSFWNTLINVYNHMVLEDRFFAPSSIALFLRDKKNYAINYNNFFYLFQQYQPKASILNPYTIYWILGNYFSGDTIFTPVLSWNSYLMAFFHTNYKYYLGVDVMESVCNQAIELSNYYKLINNTNSSRTVKIKCGQSEMLKYDDTFMNKYKSFFDTIIWCPPYFNMEIYQGEKQSTALYPTYSDWLSEYFEETVLISQHVIKHNGLIGVIMNDYYTLDNKYYPLINDFNLILSKYFTLINILDLVNRTSPLRVNKKNRTEKMFIYRYP